LLFPDGLFLVSPICEIGLPLTSVRFSLVHTFLTFLCCADAFGSVDVAGPSVACDAAGGWVAGESCSGNFVQAEADTVVEEIDTNTARINLCFMKTDYQGAELAIVDLPNSARMACRASLGGPIRRYCE
jgi:hypothetical protein